MIKQNVILACLMLGFQLEGSFEQKKFSKKNTAKVARFPSLQNNSLHTRSLPTIEENITYEFKLPSLSLKKSLITEISKGDYYSAISLLQKEVSSKADKEVLSEADADAVRSHLVKKIGNRATLSDLEMNFACLIIRNTSKK